jgi:hypothetical protein
MKYIQLTQGKVAIVDDEDFERVNQFKWCFDTGYAARKSGPRKAQVKIWLHRFIMQTPPGMDTDHINGNKLDNRKNNLRICTHSINLNNSKLARNNTTGFQGVSWSKDKKKWRATKGYFGKQFWLGYFDSPQKAHIAFLQFKQRLGVAL